MMAEGPSMEHRFLAGKRILIAGAGIAGLAFARALRQQWPAAAHGPPPSITVYERDERTLPPERWGYSLSLRSDGKPGGMQTLRSLGLLDDVLAASVADGTMPPLDSGRHGVFHIWGPGWRPWLRADTPPPDGLPLLGARVRRATLRQVLIEGVEAVGGVELHWGTACVGLVRSDGGVLHLQLSNGQTAACDYLIVADGASSKLRAQLRPGDAPTFAGAVQIGGIARFARPADVPALATRDYGMLLGGCGGGDGTGFFVAPVDATSAWWHTSHRAAAPYPEPALPLAPEEAESLRRDAAARAAGFPEPAATLVRATAAADVRVVNARDKPPFAHDEPGGAAALGGAGGSLCDAGVVFVGDANHAVSPYSGFGANMALMDGWELAVELCTAGSFGEAVQRYDKLAVPRASRTLKISHWTIALAHATGWRLWCWSIVIRTLGWFLRR